jgi:hypothetical protein
MLYSLWFTAFTMNVFMLDLFVVFIIKGIKMQLENFMMVKLFDIFSFC